MTVNTIKVNYASEQWMRLINCFVTDNYIELFSGDIKQNNHSRVFNGRIFQKIVLYFELF
jgi:hypothetical protein